MDDSIFDKFSKTIFSIRGRYKYTVNLWNLLPIYLLSPRVVIGSIDPSSGINWCQWMSMAKIIFCLIQLLLFVLEPQFLLFNATMV